VLFFKAGCVLQLKAPIKDPHNLLQTAPLKLVNGLIKLSIPMDKSSLEVFGNDGESVMVYPAEGNNLLSMASTGGIVVPSLKISDMAKLRP
jgi:fructan beta-fructosidase